MKKSKRSVLKGNKKRSLSIQKEVAGKTIDEIIVLEEDLLGASLLSPSNIFKKIGKVISHWIDEDNPTAAEEQLLFDEMKKNPIFSKLWDNTEDFVDFMSLERVEKLNVLFLFHEHYLNAYENL